jgi:hypothetical protein
LSVSKRGAEFFGIMIRAGADRKESWRRFDSHVRIFRPLQYMDSSPFVEIVLPMLACTLDSACTLNWSVPATVPIPSVPIPCTVPASFLYLYLYLVLCLYTSTVSLCHRGGRMENINAWYLNTHMVYL